MKKLAFLFLVAFFGAAATSFAQSRFTQILEIQVAPAHRPAFESYILKIKEAADKTGSSMAWGMYEVAVGKPSITYRVAISFDTWGERDQWASVPDVLSEAFDEDEAARILRDGRLSIGSMTTRVWERLEDGSSNPRTGSGPANFVEVQIRHIDPQMVPEYRSLQRKWKASLESRSDGPSVGRYILRFGDGAGTTFRRTAPFDTWAERDGWAGVAGALIQEHLGAAESQLVSTTRRRVLQRTETFVSARREDLSRRAPASTSN